MDHLAGLLQHQLAVDGSAFAQLPTILATLDASHLASSQHTTKWITRVNSLMHSKDPAVRWSGLCLALRTAELNTQLMLSQAEAWIGLVLPVLSRLEPLPIHKVAIRLLFHIFSAAMHLSEFQRQVAGPNVPKVASAMTALAEKNSDSDLQVVIMDTLNALVYLYPSLLRPVQNPIIKLSLKHLSGSFPSPTPLPLVEAAARLQASLHLTAGKAGGPAAWRKTVDGALGTANHALYILRSTLNPAPQAPKQVLDLPALPDDPMVAVPLALDRLNCMVALICSSLSTSVSRPVPVPMGPLAGFCLELLRLLPDVSDEGFHDPALRNLQASLASEVIVLGAKLLGCLSESIGGHLVPYASQIMATITQHLSQSQPKTAARVHLIHVLPPLLDNVHTFHDSGASTRLTQALLKIITPLLPNASSIPEVTENHGGGGKGKGKKRARGYEGDELLKAGTQASALSTEKSEEILTAMDALSVLLRTGFVAQATVTSAYRTALSLLVVLQQRTAQSLSIDLSFHAKVLEKLQAICVDLSSRGAAGWAAQGLAMVVSEAAGDKDASRALEHALHPRVPPPLRSIPDMESFALFRGEETKAQREAREALQLVNPSSGHPNLPNVVPSAAPNVETQFGDPGPSTSFATAHAMTSIPPPPPHIPMDTAQDPPAQRLTSFASAVTVAQPPSVPKENDPEISAAQYVRPDWSVGPSTSTSAPDPEPTTQPQAPITVDDDDDDREIPSIDMRSDSEDE